MKTLKEIIIISGLIFSIDSVNAQNINWAGLNEGNKNIITANFGYEYGLVYGLGYGRQFKSRLFPIVASLEYSFPSGKDIKDDFKIKGGVQIRWFEFHNFQFSINISGVFRRFENDFTHLDNFGSVVSGTAGYYRPKWFVAGEFGFDKAIVTNVKQSEAYKDQYPDAVSGWYVSTGGNYFYGLLAGLTLKNNDLNIRFGKMVTQDFKTTPLIPLFGQIGYNRNF
jgi:hypothetical protein